MRCCLGIKIEHLQAAKSGLQRERQMAHQRVTGHQGHMSRPARVRSILQLAYEMTHQRLRRWRFLTYSTSLTCFLMANMVVKAAMPCSAIRRIL